MNSEKQQYLSFIRTNTAYPVYRGVINIITMLLYLLAGVFALGAVVSGTTAMTRSFMPGLGILIVGLIFAAIDYFFARLFKEAALILVDIGDSVVDVNSRTSQR